MADPTTTGFDPKPRTLEARLGFAFQQQERTGLKLAAHLRAFAMAAITIWIFVLLGSAFWFYLPVIILFVISGYAHYLFSLRGFRGDGHAFLFFVVDVVLVIIALFALVSYSARAMMFAGFAYVIAWGACLVWVSTFPATVFDIPGFDYSEGRLSRFLDPYYVSMDVRIMEILVLLLTTAILATAVARGRRLIREQVYMARERSNLARYFPPSIADEIAVHDSVLGKVRSQNVAVMFVDMVGFAHMAETVSPEELIDMLRAFHRRVEAAVFEHAGTLDKFFGDVVLATFGTPEPGTADPANALRCAKHIFDLTDEWNERRVEAGFPAVRLSIGVHYGPVVVGDFGTERRLEFAVIGDTVNVASRLEESTRAVGSRMVVSNDLVDAATRDTPEDAEGLLVGFTPYENLELRGRDQAINVWTYGRIE